MRLRWVESQRATKGVDLDWLLSTGSFPVQVMAKWLSALRLVCQVVLAIETGEQGSPPKTSHSPLSFSQVEKALIPRQATAYLLFRRVG